MNRALFTAAFALGAIAIVWTASTFLGASFNAAALAITLVIGCAYLIGIAEQLQFRRATATLDSAIAALPVHTEDAPEPESWLATLEQGLRSPVRARIAGRPVALPSPVFTPYLVGLLVMLGLLGTFVGMVNTLQGAVTALQGTTELEAIRNGLAAPIQGLGVAFGTSVAGIAASAMLGLISTLSRRERLMASRQLDDGISRVFTQYSLEHNQNEAYKALQAQAETLPQVAAQLETLATNLEKLGEQIGERLTQTQQTFLDETRSSYSELAQSVGASLRDSTTESSKLAAENIQPVAETILSALTDSAAAAQQALALQVETQLQSVGRDVQSGISSMSEELKVAEAERQQRFVESQEAIAEKLADQWQSSADSAVALQSTLAENLTQHAERDQELRDQRTQQAEQLSAATSALEQSADRQRDAVEQLVAAAADMLNSTSSAFTENVSGEAARLSEAAAEFSTGATELASLGDSFGGAVESYQQSCQELIEKLSQVESTLVNAGERSDAQMGYYVAQAREIIDQSLLSQQELIERLQSTADDEVAVAEAS